jgi:hypothetical protein
MSEQIKQLEVKIAGMEKQFADPKTPDHIKTIMAQAISTAKQQLAKLTGKTDGGEPKKADEPKKKTDDEPKDGTKKKPLGRPKKEKAAPKKEASKKEEAPEEEWIEITVKGKTERFNIADCEQAIAAHQKRKERDIESGKKTRSKRPVTKTVDKIEQMVEKLVDVVPDSTKPGAVKKALLQLERDSRAAMVKFCNTTGVSKTLTQKLEDAYTNVIEPIIAEIEAEIAAKK